MMRNYCSICKKRWSCKLDPLSKDHTLGQIKAIWKCQNKTMDAVRSCMSKRYPLSQEPKRVRDAIISFLYSAQFADFVESALQYTDNFELCYDLVKLASYRLAEIRGKGEDWTRRDRAMANIKLIAQDWERDGRKGGK